MSAAGASHVHNGKCVKSRQHSAAWTRARTVQGCWQENGAQEELGNVAPLKTGMETAIRHLRDGRQGRPQAPLHLLIQQADSLGGAAMLSAMLAAILDSITQGRVDAAAALALTFVETECTLRRRHPATAQARLQVAPHAACDSFHRFAQQALLQTSAPGGQVYVVIDCLSTALMYHAPADVLQALRALQASPRVAGILTLIVPELQPQAHVDTVRALATCETLLRPVTHSQATVLLAATGRHVHLEAVTSSLRHSGAPLLPGTHAVPFQVRVVSDVYGFQTCGNPSYPCSRRQLPCVSIEIAMACKHTTRPFSPSGCPLAGRIKIDSALYEMLDTGLLRQHRAPADTVVTAQQLAAADLAGTRLLPCRVRQLRP